MLVARVASVRINRPVINTAGCSNLEINTIGSKASDAGIQKHVVVMKEELEKIKEQLNNVV